jgi:hypothetical protein
MLPADSFLKNKFSGECWLSTAYLAPVEYYVVLANAGLVMLEQYEYYQKQSYRNRCTIASSGGPMPLSIPVEKPSGEKCLIRDVRISSHGNWQKQHWKSIESAYNSSPFFEYYVDDLIPFFEKKFDFLWDFNQSLMMKMIELLDIQPNFMLSESYCSERNDATDLRDLIHPKRSQVLTYLPPYYQVFESRNGFSPNLSIIDLLFNMGNESIFHLKSL